MFFIAINSLMR